MTNSGSSKISKSVGILFSAFYLLLTTVSVQAQGLVPCDGLGEDPCTVSDFFQLFANIYNFLLGMAAIVAVFMFVLAGVRMLVYYWSEHPEAELEAAKLTIRRAIFGIILIVTAYLVVNTVLGILGAGPLTNFLGVLGL